MENTPEFKAALGCITVAVWKNPNPSGGQPILKVSTERRYKDNSGNWKTTPTLNPNDIPKAIRCLQEAYDYLFELKREGKEQGENPEEISEQDSQQELVQAIPVGNYSFQIP